MAHALRPVPDDEVALFERAAAHVPFALLEQLTPAALQGIAREYGVDFSTALLYDRLRKSAAHADFITRVERALASPPDVKPAVNWKIVIVPGALYIERPDLGGDGKPVRDAATALGFRTDLVPLASRGSVTDNAARLAAWLERQSEEKLVLVSLSKGGADLKLALTRPDAAWLFRNVQAWVNVCGPLNGSPIGNWIVGSRLRRWAMRLQYRIQRRDFGFITGMCHGPGSLLHDAVRLPVHIRLVSVLGFPLRAHLSTPLSRFCHRLMAPLGPNDGTALLSDARAWPGHLLPVWGADHYFRPAPRARALLHAILCDLADVSCGPTKSLGPDGCDRTVAPSNGDPCAAPSEPDLRTA